MGVVPSPIASDCMIVCTCHGLQTLGVDMDVQEISKKCETWPPLARLQSCPEDGLEAA